MFDLGGKVALVTGGASGLGAAIALGLAERGAEVAIADLNLQSAAHVARQITEMGGPGQLVAGRRQSVRRGSGVRGVGRTRHWAH